MVRRGCYSICFAVIATVLNVVGRCMVAHAVNVKGAAAGIRKVVAAAGSELILTGPMLLATAQRITNTNSETKSKTTPDTSDRFPSSVKDVVVGSGYVPRREFNQRFDTGIPMKENNPRNDQVLILYSNENALPTMTTNSSTTLDDAIEHCGTVHVVMTQKSSTACLAIVGNDEIRSAHVHSWSRSNTNDDFDYAPFHYYAAKVPSPAMEQSSFHEMINYLQHYEEAMNQLKPILSQASTGGTHEKMPITVMVANHGHMYYFVNFVCSARARGIDISNLVLFATDIETYNLAKSMNILVYYNEAIFGAIPKDEPTDYNSRSYGRIFMSKVYCVHLVNALGYDLLFADLDMTWYQDPIPYFTNRTDDFDIYISYNGKQLEPKFKPLQANTGFYFVRSNARTRHFFSMFLRMGDLVLAENSHQAIFIMLANEHSSLRGLRVKTLFEDWELFLTGYDYLRRRKSVEKVIDGKLVPYIFHANYFVAHEKQSKMIETKNWFTDISNEQCKFRSSDKAVLADPMADCCLAQPAVASP